MNHMKKVIKKLHDYKIDPFGDGPARHITTGREIDCQIVNDMLQAPEIGKEKYKEFIGDRLVTGEVDYFQPIKRLKLKTGLAKEVKKPKSVSVLKEDRQAFGTMLSQSINLEEALRYPLTLVPLSIATPDEKLRPAKKHLLRNYIIADAYALTHECPQNARLLIDEMAAMRSIKQKATYRDWFISLFKLVTPRDDRNPIRIEVINDSYLSKGKCQKLHERKERKGRKKSLPRKFWPTNAGKK